MTALYRRIPPGDIGVNDSWIAATALALGGHVVARDDDFHDLEELDVTRV